jgi:hypothetical protein
LRHIEYFGNRSLTTHRQVKKLAPLSALMRAAPYAISTDRKRNRTGTALLISKKVELPLSTLFAPQKDFVHAIASDLVNQIEEKLLRATLEPQHRRRGRSCVAYIHE